MEKKLYEFCIYIGRFQPFHKGHLNSIKFALKQAQKLIVVIGGAYLSPSIRGPWTVQQRIEMIMASLSSRERKNILFISLRDRLYCEEKWIQNLQGEVVKITQGAQKIALVGHEKDSSSYYLKIFPQWDFLETGNFSGINATDIRYLYYLKNDKKKIQELVPKAVFNYLVKYYKTQEFKELKRKFIYIANNKNKIYLESVINLLIYCSNYVLLIKSKDILKQGLYSLPEALNFIPDFEKNALVNMANEFKIDLPANDLAKSFVSHELFSYSERFPLGKQVSKTYFFKLKAEFLPLVKTSRNSHEVTWILLEDLPFLESQLYADHYQIIQKFKKYFD